MTTDQLIKDIIKTGESEQLEFKVSVRNETIGKVVCSFLNGIGGQILIGVDDNGKIIGIKKAENISAQLQSYLSKEVVPEAPVTVSVEQYQEKEILSVKVWAGSKQPYVFDGSIFYRKGSQTVKASSKDISELIHNREQAQIHWERQIVLNAELDDLDLEEINLTIEASIKNVGIKEIMKDPIDFLSYYGLFTNGNFTNAAIVLFAKSPAKFLPQCRVRLSYLQEGKTGSAFKDDRLLEGNLFKNLNAITDFFQNHLEIRRTFSNKEWQRSDDLQYPLVALREGVLNALVHRDYSNVSGSTSIIIYPDKLEITNSGQLSLRPSELKKSHLSMPFNPDIAQIAFLRGYIEKIGRGTLKIIDACKKAGLKTPLWSDESSAVKLTFFNNYDLRKFEGLNEGLNEGLIDSAIAGYYQGISENVKDRLKDVLEVINKNEGVRTNEINKNLNIPTSTLERYIKQLRDVGLIEFRGSSRTGGYFVQPAIKKK